MSLKLQFNTSQYYFKIGLIYTPIVFYEQASDVRRSEANIFCFSAVLGFLAILKNTLSYRTLDQ
jgi:hypothetical protein